MESVLVLVDLDDTALDGAVRGLADHLADCGLTAEVSPGLPNGSAAPADLVVVWANRVDEGREQALLDLAERGTPVLLAGPTLAACGDRLADAAGLRITTALPVHEFRVRPGRGDAASRVFARTAGDLVVRDTWSLTDKVADDAQVLATASSAFTDHPVATVRESAGGTVAALTLGRTPGGVADAGFRRFVHRLVRELMGEVDRDPVRVGVLGYGAIGHEHNLAIQAVEGLTMAAVCDPNPLRVDAARSLAPDVLGFSDGQALLASNEVDLIIVSTPPNTHADWALRVLEAGKHCVVEKPFCLTVDEADRQIDAAAERGLSLSVYQNRRWDADFLALARAWPSLGEVFHYESFIGSYGHPCNFWHSDEAVSGGAIYDWGSHYLDWVLHLMPQQVEHVTAATHKRVWHDVTNADHSRVTIRFTDGAEAEFTHSDLAAAKKPKWYVLGTQGAVVGSWRDEKVVSRSPIGTLAEDLLAASDSPARMALHGADGAVTELAVPPSPPQPFHRELADSLLTGVPMSVTPEGSRRNIAVMQAATLSAADHGRPVRLP